jgi:hypothetical protein
MSVTLKPCPICGKQVEVGDFSGQHWFIFCECGLEFAPDGISTRDELIEAWNRRPSGWIKVSDAPIPGYETILMGLWVYNKRTDKRHFEQYILQYDQELGELWDGDDCFSEWELSDFEVWMPLPSAPEVEE